MELLEYNQQLPRARGELKVLGKAMSFGRPSAPGTLKHRRWIHPRRHRHQLARAAAAQQRDGAAGTQAQAFRLDDPDRPLLAALAKRPLQAARERLVPVWPISAIELLAAFAADQQQILPSRGDAAELGVATHDIPTGISARRPVALPPVAAAVRAESTRETTQLSSVSRDILRAVLEVRDHRHNETHAVLLTLFQAMAIELVEQGLLAPSPLADRLDLGRDAIQPDPHGAAARHMLDHVVTWLRSVQPGLPPPHPVRWTAPDIGFEDEP